jgi:hypothetical protein
VQSLKRCLKQLVLQRVGLFNFGEELFFLHLLQRVFNVFDSAYWLLKCFAASLPMNIEAEDFGLVKKNFGRQYNGVGEMLHENMWKAGSKVGTVNIDLSEFGKVNLFATWAKNLES